MRYEVLREDRPKVKRTREKGMLVFRVGYFLVLQGFFILLSLVRHEFLVREVEK